MCGARGRGKEREGMKKIVCVMVLVLAVSSLALGGCKKKENKGPAEAIQKAVTDVTKK